MTPDPFPNFFFWMRPWDLDTLRLKLCLLVSTWCYTIYSIVSNCLCPLWHLSYQCHLAYFPLSYRSLVWCPKSHPAHNNRRRDCWGTEALQLLGLTPEAWSDKWNHRGSENKYLTGIAQSCNEIHRTLQICNLYTRPIPQQSKACEKRSDDIQLILQASLKIHCLLYA